MTPRALVAAATLVGLSTFGCATARTSPVAEVGEPGKVIPHEADCLYLAKTMSAWQMRLGLGGWSIEVFCQEAPEAPPELLGLSRWDLANRRAAIWIRPDGHDQELTVIHELLHLPFATSCAVDSELVREQYLRAIARALRNR